MAVESLVTCFVVLQQGRYHVLAVQSQYETRIALQEGPQEFKPKERHGVVVIEDHWEVREESLRNQFVQ